MKIHNLTQGSPEWLAYRAQHFNASDAPAMMGCSPYKTRAQLLRELHTGLAAEVDAGTQRVFDAGHRFEALARPLAEQIIGEELYPVVGSEGRLSASFDGLTLAEDTAFEHKSANAELRAVLTGEDCAPMLPLHYRVQMEQQLMVSGAQRVLFMATLWDGEANTFARHCWYEPDAELRAAILRGWDQFAADLAAFELPKATEPAPVGKAPDQLPALRIEVTGMVTASNLAEFKATALAAIQSVNRDLKTDADFADAEKAVKWCGDVESRLAAAKDHALSQTASIDALFKAIDDISAEARRVRLDLDKLVKRRKDEVREQAVAAAGAALAKHIAAVNAEVAPMRLQQVSADFAGAIKGKRSISSMQDALDTTLAAAKIAADAQGRAIRANVTVFKAATGDQPALLALFADLGQLVHKAADDFGAVVDQRITKHRADEAAAEARRQAEEAARIAIAEQRAREQAQREAEQRIADERAKHVQAEAAVQRQAAAALAASTEQASAPVVAAAPAQVVPQPLSHERAAVREVCREFVQAKINEPATLKLGTICERLGFTVTAAFLADVLHIKAADSAGRAVLYRESQFAVICHQLRSHISAMAELYSEQQAA